MNRKNHTPEFKARVALEAPKGLKTLCAYGVHPNQISQWKRHLQSESRQVFTRHPTPDPSVFKSISSNPRFFALKSPQSGPNNGSHLPAINCKRRLLILSCSQRKHASHEPLPAIDRYNGPLFLVLRRFLRECPHRAGGLDVYILSAAHGFIPGDFPVEWYDQKMDLSRVVALQSQVKTTFSGLLCDNNYGSICFVLGKTYLKAFEGTQDLIPVDTESVVACGGIGKKSAQLKQWLWRESG